MLQKLRLNKADKYQLIIATSYISKMLVNFVQGKEHYLDIGCEQGDIPTWDDLVIQSTQGVYEHVQIKRQTTKLHFHHTSTKAEHEREIKSIKWQSGNQIRDNAKGSSDDRSEIHKSNQNNSIESD